jgi:O-glycosyl hydrolase
MKRNFKLWSVILLGAILICSCSSDSDDDEITPPLPKDELIINIDPTTIFQTIEHFGASDAWSCQFVGNWPSEKKNAIADLLFSKDMNSNGKPIGIGLSLWRFNIGAGSAEQGSLSGINDEWRRAESFLEPDGTYNWEKQQGQVWFAESAKNRGVDKLLTFVNSPPVHITKNGKAHSNNGESNLAVDQFDEYAKYLATVIDGLQNKGLKVDYISPVNEPQWDWTGGQEGAPFWNNDIAEIARELDKELELKNLATLIDIAEAGKINYLYEYADKSARANQIDTFFNQSSSNYIGDLSHYGNAISGHSYFTTSPFSDATSIRMKLSQKVSNFPNLNFWMSEYCILGDNSGEIEGNGRDLGINPALYIAKAIHNDLVVAQASAWHWWLAISPYDYKDGLVYIDYEKENGQYYESKMLWTLGNYSRFIRPGYQRIAIKANSGNFPNEKFLFSAYKNPNTDELVVVIVNSGTKATEIKLVSQNHSLANQKGFITSQSKNLEPYSLSADSIIEVPAQSIITLIINN